MNIADNIKKFRKEKKLTQKELASKLGVTSITIQNYENDRRKPDIKTLNKIAELLGVTPNDLIGEVHFKGTKEQILNEIDNADYLPIERKEGFKRAIIKKDYEVDELNAMNISYQEALDYIRKLVAYSKPSVGPNGSQYRTILKNVLEYIEFELYRIEKERNSPKK